MQRCGEADEHKMQGHLNSLLISRLHDRSIRLIQTFPSSLTTMMITKNRRVKTGTNEHNILTPSDQ